MRDEDSPYEESPKNIPAEEIKAVSDVRLDSSSEILENLSMYLESLLFVSSGEVHPTQLASALQIPVDEVERGLELLADNYNKPDSGRGLRLQRYRGRYQLVTAAETTPWVERFLGLEATNRLSRAAMETLAIVLYRQPVTRPQIESIRGVNSDYVLHSLLLKGLVQEIGRSESPGRPILYTATSDCLQYFGLTSLTELPPLDIEDQE